jgi:hypothetical protein
MIKKLLSFLLIFTMLFTTVCFGYSGGGGTGTGGKKGTGSSSGSTVTTSGSSITTEKTQTSQKKEAFKYLVKVSCDGKVLKKYSIEDIKKMPASSIKVDGKTENGPTLISLLAKAGIKKYTKIIIKGMAKDSMTLLKKQIDKNTILDISNRDTIKYSSKTIAKSKWVKDIVEIIASTK